MTYPGGTNPADDNPWAPRASTIAPPQAPTPDAAPGDLRVERLPGIAPALSDEVYVGTRLRYGPVDTNIAGLVDGRLLRSVIVRAVAFWAVCMAVAVAFAMPFVVVGSFLKVASVTVPLAGLASWLAFLFPLRVPVSEWHWVVEGRGTAGRTAHAEILRAFRERQTPATIEVRRAVQGKQHVREYLRAHQGRFVANVSAFGYGEDLYVGWTMWWEVLPPVALWDFARQAAASLFSTGAVYFGVFRADQAKAFREVVHSATREGVDAAFREDAVPDAATTFGAGVIVDSVPAWA
jgi:hypothetical protein